MRMKNRFSRMGTTLLGAVCLLSTCGVTYSCSDDYDLDETMPSFLKGSIYDELKATGKFTTVVRLIDDLDYADVLSKTGSKTMFVADDEAYARFFQSTDWVDGSGAPIRSYDQLSIAQKRYLLNNSMLNNAYVLEMMSNTTGGGKNLCLRQGSSASPADTVPFWKYQDLPVNYNMGGEGETMDIKPWESLQGKEGIYMALDATTPMITHFLDGQMREKNIKHSDVAFILTGDPNSWAETENGGENRSYIYDRQIVEADITCMNGYYHVLDEVLLAPSNMAEEIRKNPKTKLFSHMLDRFSAPYYNADLTQSFQALYDNSVDSVYEKRYFSMRSQGGAQLNYWPEFRKQLPASTSYLTFDPGWNEYALSSTSPKETDMAVMFVPTDEAMEEYFVNGGGRALLERYAPDATQSLEYRMDQIPLRIIKALVNNLMKASFNESVPSKYRTIMNDARDRMFSGADFPNESDFYAAIDTCMLANNGLVYVMNTVISPADYASVAGPVLFSEDTKVVQTVICADDDYIQGSNFANAPLQQYFNTLLKAMQSRFSFFVPTDAGLKDWGYVDPAGWARGGNYKRYWRFTKDDNFTPTSSTSRQIAINAVGCNYREEQGTNPNDKVNTTYLSRSNEALDNTSGYAFAKKTMLIEMINQHILVHDNDDTEGMNGTRNYYISRGGAPIIRVAKSSQTNSVGMLVNGGFQDMLKADAYPENDHNCQVVESYDQSPEKNGYGNGMTYLLDRPMQPTMRSVYYILKNAENYSEFFKQCEYYSADLLETAGFRESLLEMLNRQIEEQNKNIENVDQHKPFLELDDITATQWQNECNKYRVFTDMMNAQNGEMLVRFLNNYRYTLYVPTNEAMQRAYANGLPTWEDIDKFVNDPANQEDGVLTPTNKYKAQAMITMLVNFLKYHFQDQSLYVDNVNSPEELYQTSCINNETNMYISLNVQQSPDALVVKDITGKLVNVVAPYNVLARDMVFNAKGRDASCKHVTSSSFVAIHQIPDVLNFTQLSADGRYDKEWATAGKAKAFAAKYRIRK